MAELNDYALKLYLSGDDHPVDDMPGAGAVKRSPIDGVNSSGVNEGGCIETAHV